MNPWEVEVGRFADDLEQCPFGTLRRSASA